MLERKPKDTQQSNRVPCFKIQIRIINMKHDTKQLISQPDRNNSFRKIILDTYDCKRVMVAETEDLIIEYCMTTEKITNLCAKEGEEESLYARMRRRHLRDWPDDTLRIKDDGHSKSISEFRKQLLGLKHYTASLESPRYNVYPESFLTVQGLECRRERTILRISCYFFVECHITALLKIN